MGQAPTRPFDVNNEILCHTNMDISHLPDLSPFPRQVSYSATKKPEHETAGRPPAYRSRSKSSQSKSSASKSGGKQERRPHSSKKSVRKEHKVERKLTKERGWKVVQEASDVGSSQQKQAAPSLPMLAIIPRIDIVESSPVITQMLSTSPRASIPNGPIGTSSAIPRSPSMPAFLPTPTPSYSESVRPALSRPSTSPTFHSLPMLPLPGTPFAEQPLIQLIGFESSASPWIATPYEGHTSEEEGEERLSQSLESIVTQQIRILRVTNPDPRSVTTSRSQTPQPMTLAEKQNVSAPPSHLKIVPPGMPRPTAVTPPQGRDVDRLSPTTPSSAASSTVKDSSDPSSPSTAATSAPPSPAKPPTGLGLCAATLAVPPSAERHRAVSTPVSPVPLVKQGRRASGSPVAIAIPTKNAGQGVRRASQQSRARSNSHESSDGDRSGTCSSASIISEAGRDKSKAYRKKKGRPSAAAAKEKAARPVEPSKETLPPALVSVALAVPKSPIPPPTVSESFLPPRSPRPPNTPRLGGFEEPCDPFVTEASSLLAPPPPEIPYALPPASPLKMDWFTTDLLVRCGIQPTSLGPIPAREKVSSAFLGHPVSLQPRATSPIPSYSPALLGNYPLPGTPFDVEFPETLLSAPKSSEQPAESSPPVRTEPETPQARRERKKAEKAARYEAFQKLAQMAVESPNNPFLDANGAVRLGEYKRGQTDREIWKWCRNVRKAVAEEKLEKLERRKASTSSL